MEFLTRSQLNSQKLNFEKSNPGVLNESINLRDKRFSLSTEVTIFLSHKHNERKELEAAIAIFKKLKVNIYVDWNDEGMPESTSGLTAVRLKSKIKSSKKFVLLATEAAINSKWCNWELGFGDAHKYIENIALLVIKEDSSAFSGSEYLNIYPVIGRRYAQLDDYYDVQFPDGTTKDLLSWLNS
jgi:hypothetical protein